VKRRPRILFIVPSTYDALKKKGTHLMIRERSESGFFERVITFHPVAPRTRRLKLDAVHTVSEFGLDLLPIQGRILRLCQRPFRAFRVLSSLCRTVRSEQIDVIRANDPYWMGLYGWVTSRLTGRPLAISIHANYDLTYRLNGRCGAPTILGSRRLSKRMERFILRHADRIFPISHTLGNIAIGLGAEANKVRVIPHGFDCYRQMEKDTGSIRSSFGIREHHRVISFAARLSNETYVYDVLRASRFLAETHDDFTVIIAGSGTELEKVRDFVNSDPVLGEHVRLTGFLSRDRVYELRSISDVSLCLMGGFSLIEACAAGSVPISYAVEWHGELVRNGETGFLVSEGDVDGVACAMAQVLDDPELAKSLGTAAQRLARSRHDIGVTTHIKRQHYLELLQLRAHRHWRTAA
jgi:glycosyltransferase involved in cell wall biosynthesis